MTPEQKAQNNARFDHNEKLAGQIYGGPQAPNHSHAMASYFSQLESQLRWRNDREGLQKAGSSRKQIAAWAAKHGVDGNKLWKDFLARQLEYDSRPMSQEAIEARRSLTWQQLCEAEGGETGARAVLDRAAAAQAAFQAEVPDMAPRTATSFEDHDIVRFFADVPATTTQEPAT